LESRSRGNAAIAGEDEKIERELRAKEVIFVDSEITPVTPRRKGFFIEKKKLLEFLNV
jgi:hypothetical protein